MAIGVNSVVAVKVSSTALAFGLVTPQPPVFGSNESASSPFTVTWSNGSRVVGIPAGQLDEITTPGSTALGMLGKVVSLTGGSPAGQGLVVSAYARSGVDVVLLKTLQNDAFIEAPAAGVTISAGL